MKPAKTVKAKVLKPFPYASEGTNTRDVAEGEVLDVDVDIVGGLIAEGFVRVAQGKVPEPVRQAKRKAARAASKAKAKA